MEGFPAFEKVFKEGISVPRYLELLNLASDKDGIEDALATVRSAVDACPDVAVEVQALLADLNWRPNLVGAVAMLLGAASPATIAALWTAFDRGSWVSPQLAVTAFKVDPAFAEQAKRRILSGCPIDNQAMSPLSPLERHVAAGPAGTLGLSAKAMSVLTFLFRKSSNAEPAVISLFEKEPISTLVLADEDNGAEIANEWLSATNQYMPSASP